MARKRGYKAPVCFCDGNGTHLRTIWVGIWTRFTVSIASPRFEAVPSAQNTLSTPTVSRGDAHNLSAVVPVVADGVLGP
jgi:hypothetical protein